MTTPRKTTRAAKRPIPPARPVAQRLTLEQIIEDLIRREGGFVDDPADRGGATNMGITIGTLGRYLGRRATVDEVRALSRAEVFSIYDQLFWSGPGFHRLDLDQRIVINVFDAGVMSGPSRAIRWLQEVLRDLGGQLTVDGVLGPETSRVGRQIQERVGIVALNNAFCDRRQRFYDSIVARDESQSRFRRGWTNRVSKFRLSGTLTEIRNVSTSAATAQLPEPPVEDIGHTGRAVDSPAPATSAARDPVVVSGAATSGLAAISAAQEIISAATQAQAAAEAFPWLRVGLAIAIVIAAGVLAYGFWRFKRSEARARIDADPLA